MGYGTQPLSIGPKFKLRVESIVDSKTHGGPWRPAAKNLRPYTLGDPSPNCLMSTWHILIVVVVVVMVVVVVAVAVAVIVVVVVVGFNHKPYKP